MLKINLETRKDLDESMEYPLEDLIKNSVNTI